MLKGIDINERFEFVSKYDKTEPKTVFVFRYLTGSDMFSLRNSDEGFIINILEKSIVEIQNMPEGKSVSEFLRILPSNVLNELFEKFNEINDIDEEDKKKS